MRLTTIGNFVIVDIHKPMSVQADYDFCRVRKEYYDKAKTMGKYVLVRTPNGERVMLPKHMKDFPIVKEVFLYPDRPMEMYEVTVPHGQKKQNEYYMFNTDYPRIQKFKDTKRKTKGTFVYREPLKVRYEGNTAILE